MNTEIEQRIRRIEDWIDGLGALWAKAHGLEDTLHPTPPPAEPVPTSTDYTDTQFAADLARHSDKLNEMVKQAVEEHERGASKPFPAEPEPVPPACQGCGWLIIPYEESPCSDCSRNKGDHFAPCERSER